MNTTAKVIMKITAVTAAGTILGMLLAPKQRASLVLKIKSGVKTLRNDFPSKIYLGKGEMTSELIDIDQ